MSNEDEEEVGSIFDDAGEDEDFVSEDLFADTDDDLSDVSDDFDFGDIFADDDSDDKE